MIKALTAINNAVEPIMRHSLLWIMTWGVVLTILNEFVLSKETWFLQVMAYTCLAFGPLTISFTSLFLKNVLIRLEKQND